MRQGTMIDLFECRAWVKEYLRGYGKPHVGETLTQVKRRGLRLWSSINNVIAPDWWLVVIG